jgi:hypothetical protein
MMMMLRVRVSQATEAVKNLGIVAGRLLWAGSDYGPTVPQSQSLVAG